MKHTDTERLDWWETHINYEYSPDYESIEGEVESVIYRVNGGYNDRIWTEVGRGKTIREALDMTINNEQL